MTVSTDLNPLAGDDRDGAARSSAFQVHLDVFEGPFDLLLALISKHKLDITEVALSQVTDEFIAFISERSDDWDLDQVSYFLVVAATLLDLKAARLLPSGEVEDEEDLALLEARDLLFARLLQYRAYKEVAAIFAARMTAAAREDQDRKSTRLNSSHLGISYAVFCLKKKKKKEKKKIKNKLFILLLCIYYY